MVGKGDAKHEVVGMACEGNRKNSTKTSHKPSRDAYTHHGKRESPKSIRLSIVQNSNALLSHFRCDHDATVTMRSLSIMRRTVFGTTAQMAD